MRKRILIFIVILIPFLTNAQELFRSGRFLHHSTGGRIWGPNGSQTSIPLQMGIYNSSHGYTGPNAVTMNRQWYPGGDNEWEYWHRIFDNEAPEDITPILNSNKIVVIKSCYPSSEMVGWGQPSDTLTPTLKTNYNYKWHWRSIVNVMSQRPQNFFVIWTNAPHVAGNTNSNAAGLAKQFCEWAKDTLAVGLDPVIGSFPPNIYVFDYFSKLTDENGFQMLQYAVSNTDSHPNALATELVAPQFVTEIFDAAIAYEQSIAILTVSPQNQNVPAAAGSTTFNVTTTLSWTAQSNTGWCTVTPSGNGNGTLTASFSENTSTTSRTATITISASGAPDQSVSVIQAGAAATLSVSPQSQNVGAAQGSANFSVVSNTSWTAQSNTGWCTVTPSGSGNGTLTASFSENTSTTSRTATITISASGAPDQSVSVIQAGAAATLSVSPQSQNVGAAQGSANFSVVSNTSWTAQSNTGWCTVTPSGNGNGTLTASFSENTTTTSRTATITISASGAPDQTVSVIQAGAAATLSVSPQSQNVGAAQGNANFSIVSNTSWTAQSNTGWCTVTPSGNGNGTLTASFSENTSTTSRTATITISATGAPDQTVSVIQAGAAATLSVSPQSQNVGAAQGSANFSVVSNTSWTAQSNTGWCTVTPSGNGNGTLTASFSENTTTTSRTATITISASGAPDQTVSVIQAGAAATLSVSPQSQNVGAAQGNANFSIVSNTSWTAQSNAGWCTVTPSGNGNGTLTASFSENTSTTSRTATITISATGAPDQTVSVIQAGAAATLSVSPQSQNVGAAQGSVNFSVVSNTSWTAQSNAGWCTVTPSGSGNGTLTASFSENTTTTSRTATITISATGAPDQTVSVIQAGAAATLSVSPASQTVNSPAGSTGFNVVSNSQWNAVSDSEWCTVTSAGSGNGTLTADYDENTGTATRTAIITISATGAGNQTVNLVQFGSDAALAVSPEYQNVECEAGETFFEIISNTSWTATSNELWCTVTPYGNGNFEITATYEANEEVYPRSANITISAAGVSDHIVTVIQSGIEATLSVSPTSQTVPSTEGEAVFSLLSNSMWNVSSDVEWCIPISDSGSGNGEIVTYYEPNETEYYRTAILTISAFGTDDVFVSLVQEGLLTGIDPKQQNKSFKIFPNPTTGQFMVEVPDQLSGETEIEVLDAQGKKTAFILRNKTLSTFNIDLSAASPGIYFVLLRNGSVELKQKLVLRR